MEMLGTCDRFSRPPTHWETFGDGTEQLLFYLHAFRPCVMAVSDSQIVLDKGAMQFVFLGTPEEMPCLRSLVLWYARATLRCSEAVFMMTFEEDEDMRIGCFDLPEREYVRN